MRSETELESALTKLRNESANWQMFEAKGAPKRRTPLEQRAFDEGRLAMLEWVADLPEDAPRELKYVPMPGEV